LYKVSQAGKGELVFASALFLTSLVVFWDTSGLILPTNNTIVSPRTFPYAVATILMLASLGIVFEVLRGRSAVPEGTLPGTPFQRADFKTMLIIVIAIGLHTFLLERMGYVIAATISFWGVAYAFGAKKLLKLGAIAFFFAILVFFCFTNLLDIQLPEWIIEDAITKLGN
jgi:putative tricarboxylic transport membrane protein